MSRKNKKSKKLDGETDQDSAEANENLTEPVAAAEEASTPNPEDATLPEESSEDRSVEPSADDLLDDIRRSLIEDDALEGKKQSKWWKRIGRGSQKEEPRIEEPKAVEEIDLPIVNETVVDSEIDELKDELESDEYVDQIDELIELLDDDTEVAAKPVRAAEETPPEPEKAVDLEELKKQAFQPRPAPDNTETLSEVRSIALEGDEEVFVEVESKPQDPMNERIKAVENAFKPYRSYIYFAIAFLGVVMAVIAFAIIYSVFQRMRPEPVVEEVASLPFPSAVNLPGGWTFNLSKGSLKDGRWEPHGAEWLEGTEVCRWVSLPWSRQLEAVLRTLNPDDPIELTMSNSDKLLYKVYSIRQMSPDEMQALDTNSPCLLIMLAEEGAEKRWVLTALP